MKGEKIHETEVVSSNVGEITGNENTGEFREFRELLKKGIGARTQVQFARETGISRTTINRMLNNEQIPRPSQDTLKILARHFTDVTYLEMLRACGYPEPDIKEAAANEKKNLSDGFKDEKGTLWTSTSDLLDLISLLYASQDIKWQKDKDGTSAGVTSISCERYETYRAHWLYAGYAVDTFVTLGLADTKGGKIVLTDFTMDIDAMKKDNTIFNRDGFEPDKKTSAYIREDRNRNRASAADILLSSILGASGKEYVKMDCGCGFPYSATPENFEEYVMENVQYFCTTKETVKLFQEMISTDRKPDEIFEHFMDANAIGDPGTGAAIAWILSNKTGREFAYFAREVENDHDDSCIMTLLDNDIDRIDDSLKLASYETAAYFGIKTFGMMYHRSIENEREDQVYKTDEYHYSLGLSHPRSKDEISGLLEKAKKIRDHYYKISDEFWKHGKEFDEKKTSENIAEVLLKLRRLQNLITNLSNALNGKKENIMDSDVSFIKEEAEKLTEF